MKAFIAALLLVSWNSPAFAVDAEPQLGDPELQARYDKLISELRCLVCQTESIADSNAGLAADLRREVRSLVLEGKTDAQILSFMTERYGDSILYRPPLAPRTLLLWALPGILLVIGGIAAFRVIARRSKLVDSDPDEPEPADRA